MKILTASEMREVDRLTTERYGIPSLSLMENAGKSIADFMSARFRRLESRRIIVLCGKGNNGGDGFVTARHLADAGATPIVILVAAQDEMRGDAATNRDRWQKSGGEVRVVRASSDWQTVKPSVNSADLIVDALLGTGVKGAVEGLLSEVIHEVNRRERGRIVIAVDIPSGLPADMDGTASENRARTKDSGDDIVAANYTVTFTAPKAGMFLGNATASVGQLLVREIGSPPELVEEVGKGTVRWLETGEFSEFALPREPDGNKGNYGHALIVAGSVGKSGAAVMASWAALRIGAGLVTAAVPEPVLPLVAAPNPEVMTEPLPATDTGSISLRALEYERFNGIVKGKSVIGIGPGLTTQTETVQFVRAVVGKYLDLPIVLDADGLNAFDGHAQQLKAARKMLAVTPHPGEMARLVGSDTKQIQSRRLEVARKAAAEWNAFVILKGYQTVIAAPNGDAWINSTGNAGMATGGTGDVLTGMLAGLIAQHGVGVLALCFGVYLHGLAGDIAYADSGEAPLMATDLIRSIPRAYQQFYAESGRV
ncbi:MAG TPA: NAD(P)H-hydrate dehydratase [Candidatus Dormibacteraeota bacterium]|nr:NAD(P)H-hydrate dehydratase [Candidatus Dormibacteraeota bacterium]